MSKTGKEVVDALMICKVNEAKEKKKLETKAGERGGGGCGSEGH